MGVWVWVCWGVIGGWVGGWACELRGAGNAPPALHAAPPTLWQQAVLHRELVLQGPLVVLDRHRDEEVVVVDLGGGWG